MKTKESILLITLYQRIQREKTLVFTFNLTGRKCLIKVWSNILYDSNNLCCKVDPVKINEYSKNVGLNDSFRYCVTAFNDQITSKNPLMSVMNEKSV